VITLNTICCGKLIYLALFPRPSICAINLTVVFRICTVRSGSLEQNVAETSFNQDPGHVNPGQDTDDHTAIG
jgi:hypothetical protein